MSNIRRELVNAAYDRAYSLIQNDDMHKRFDSLKQFILDDESLTKDEKLEAIKRFDGDYDYFKVLKNDGTRRICENCQERCLATLYCEYCMRNDLKTKFSNWTSGNNEVDNLIKKCQMETIIPYMIVEWIPYDKLQNVEYLSKGGRSDIHSADWTDGHYKEWDAKEKKLKRAEPCKVVLKTLENVESANMTWIEEAATRLYISNKWGCVVQCYGLTKHPSNGTFILVMSRMDVDLRKYIQQNRNQITWKTKIQIIFEVTKAICRIHEENFIFRDLHPGNVLYSRDKNDWYINDLKFCGPADKQLKGVYGNLPYVAPEVISKNEYTFKSDIYGIAMLMWEISAEQQPFINHAHNYDLATKIVNGMRPQILPGTPLEYKELMLQCWNADPEKRPNTKTLWIKIEEINKLFHQNNEYWSSTNSASNQNLNMNENSHSKFYHFNDLPNPKNATEGI